MYKSKIFILISVQSMGFREIYVTSYYVSKIAKNVFYKL